MRHHRYDPRYSFKWFHKKYPTIPLVSSESTSCNTQRGVNYVNTTAGAFDDVFNADCLSKHFCPPNTTKAVDESIPGYMHSPGACSQSWTMAYEDDGTIFPFMAGHLGIWTLFDYLGEPSSRNRKDPCTQDRNKDCNPNWQVESHFSVFPYILKRNEMNLASYRLRPRRRLSLSFACACRVLLLTMTILLRNGGGGGAILNVITVPHLARLPHASQAPGVLQLWFV